MLTVIVPTYNEEINLPKCLASIQPLGARVVVVDSGSTDGTIDIANQYGCDILTGNWRTFSDKINWIIDKLPGSPVWVLRVDADETLDHEFIAELRARITAAPENLAALEVNRKYYFLGKWIRHGGMSPNWSVRVWRHGFATMEYRELDEHMIVRGDIARLEKGAIHDNNLRGLSDWIDKHNRYSDKEIQQIVCEKPVPRSHLEGQRKRRRVLKEEVYLRLPLFVRPFIYWLYRYFIQLGFLDGRAGFLYHALHGFWYRLLIDAKLYERRLKVPDNRGNQAVNSSR